MWLRTGALEADACDLSAVRSGDINSQDCCKNLKNILEISHIICMRYVISY